MMPRTSSFFVSAGLDIQACDNEVVQVYGYAEAYTSLEWTTSGDGSFNNTSILDPVYTPGAQDIQNGSVTITSLTAPLSPSFPTHILKCSKVSRHAMASLM